MPCLLNATICNNFLELVHSVAFSRVRVNIKSKATVNHFSEKKKKWNKNNSFLHLHAKHRILLLREPLSADRISTDFYARCVSGKVSLWAIHGYSRYICWGIGPTLNDIISLIIYFTHQFFHRSGIIPRPYSAQKIFSEKGWLLTLHFSNIFSYIVCISFLKFLLCAE